MYSAATTYRDDSPADARDADRERPFRIPGGMPLAFMITVVCVAILAISILLFMYIPGEGFDMPVVIGAAVAILLGEVLTATFPELIKMQILIRMPN